MLKKPYIGQIVEVDGALCIYARVSRNLCTFVNLDSGDYLSMRLVNDWTPIDENVFTEETCRRFFSKDHCKFLGC